MIRNGSALLLVLGLSVTARAGELDAERPGKPAAATVAASGDAEGVVGGRELDRESPVQACWGGYSSSSYWGGYPSYSSYYWGSSYPSYSSYYSAYPSYSSSYYWGSSYPSYSSYYYSAYPSYSSYYYSAYPSYSSSYYWGGTRGYCCGW